MQTRTYGDLFKLIQSLSGVGSFAASEQDDIANFINRRYFEAYSTSQGWPRFIVNNEARDIAVIDVAGTTAPSGINGSYRLVGQVTGASVTDDTNLYMLNPSIVSGISATALNGTAIVKNSNGVWVIVTNSDFDLNAAGTKYLAVNGVLGTTQFSQLDSGDIEHPADVTFYDDVNQGSGTPRLQKVQLVPYSEQNKKNIGEFIRVHRTRPFLNNSALEYDFAVDENGANILNLTSSTDSEAFVTYKKRFTPLTTSSSYSSSTEEIPAEFFHYIAHSAYADFLRMDGQTGKAMTEEGVATNYLALELERVDNLMNQNTALKRFTTYVNRQSR